MNQNVCSVVSILIVSLSRGLNTVFGETDINYLLFVFPLEFKPYNFITLVWKDVEGIKINVPSELINLSLLYTSRI